MIDEASYHACTNPHASFFRNIVFLTMHWIAVVRVQKARRRRVPAFGEWNYNYYGSAELATPAAAAAELEARSDVWFKYSPPPRKPPPVSRKVRRPAEKSYGGSKRPRAATPARASDGVVPSSVPRTPAKSTGAARAARVVQRVDADLY